MICYNGEAVWPHDKGVPSLNSLGVQMGRIVRFAGGTREWYCVLAHSLVVAQLLPDRSAIYGLMHDTAEACCSDVPTPWKTQAAVRREHMLLKRIWKAYDLKPPTEKIQSEVDWADRQALWAEAYVLGHPTAETWAKKPGHIAMSLTAVMLDQAINFIRPEVSGPMFEQAFEHYTGMRNGRGRHATAAEAIA